MPEYTTRAERKKAESLKNIPNQVDEQMDILNQESPVSIESLDLDASSTNDKMVQGTFWMTFGSIFSRLLGALYVIPWNGMLGKGQLLGNSLFSVGYNPYQFFISIGTAGFPSAIAKQIAEYNAKKQYKAGQDLFRASMKLMVGTGIVSAVLMWVLAPIVAERSPVQSVEQGTLVIRSLAPALLVVPAMSLIRGYFQGYHDMIPSAITQVVEQIVRVAYILLATFVVMNVFSGSVPVAVAHSTFAAFVGALAALLMLFFYYQRHMKRYGALYQTGEESSISVKDAITEMVRESIPFIVIGSGITFSKFIDQFTFKPIMLRVTEASDGMIEELYSIFSFQADKLIMIIISLAVGMATTSIPLLVNTYIKNETITLGNQIRKIFELFAFVMLPSAFGMFVVAKPLYVLFYGVSDYLTISVDVLGAASIMSIILGAFTITSSILQSFSKHKEAVIFLAIGLFFKLLAQMPFVDWFGTVGTIYSTSFGFGIITLLNLIYIYKLVPFNVRATARTMGIIGLLTGWMFVVAEALSLVLSRFLDPERGLYALITVIVIGMVGAAVYVYLSLKTRIADEVLGERIGGLRRRLRIK